MLVKWFTFLDQNEVLSEASWLVDLENDFAKYCLRFLLSLLVDFQKKLGIVRIEMMESMAIRVWILLIALMLREVLLCSIIDR